MPLQNIIKIFQTIECIKIWFKNLVSGVYKKKNKARDTLLACDTPTWPDIYPIKKLSNYLRQYGSYSLHKISNPGEISTKQKVGIVCLTCDMTTSPYLCVYQIFTKYFKPLRSAQEFGLEIYSDKITRTWHAYWSLSMPVPNLIKIFQTIKKLWSA